MGIALPLILGYLGVESNNLGRQSLVYNDHISLWWCLNSVFGKGGVVWEAVDVELEEYLGLDPLYFR